MDVLDDQNTSDDAVWEYHVKKKDENKKNGNG